MMEVPRDKGWAWVVALGVFWNVTWTYGMMRSMGLIFLEIQQQYDVSATLSSLLFATSNGAALVSMPVQTYLYGKMSDRCIGAIGSAMLSLCFINMYLSHNLYLTVIVSGCLQGAGLWFVTFSNLAVLNIYFREKLSLVSGFCFMGSGLGQLVMPNLLNYLLYAFGTRGAMLVLGACMLHVLVGSSLFRPVSCYSQNSARKVNSSNDFTQTINGKPMIAYSEQKQKHDVYAVSLPGSFTYINNEMNGHHLAVYGTSNLAFVPEQGAADVTHVAKQATNTVTLTMKDPNEVETTNGCHENGVEFGSPATVISDRGTAGISPVTGHMPPETQSDAHAGNGVVVIQEDTDHNMQSSSLSDDFRRLFSTPTFPLFILGKVLILQSYVISTIFLAPFAVSEGLSTREVALILITFGAVDMITRPLHGWLVSLPHIDPAIYMSCLVISSSAVAAVLVRLGSFTSILILSCNSGLFLTPAMSLQNVITVQCVGTQLYPRALTITTFCATIGFLIIPPIFGRLYDVTGSYTIPMYIFVSLGIVGGALTILEVLVRRPIK